MKRIQLRRWCRRRGTAIGFVAITIAFVVQGIELKHLVDENHAAIIDRCRISEESRGVLNREHSRRLHRLLVYRKEHPNGTPGIISREDIDASIRDERRILRDVRPRPCP